MIPPWLAVLALQERAEDPPAEVRSAQATSSLDLSGEIVLGWRFLDVDGSQGQYDEDLNLQEGPLVREFMLKGTAPDSSGLRSFLLHAQGIGDPQTSALAELTGSSGRARFRYDRSRFEGNGVDDFHPFDLERERASARIETPGGPGDLHAAVEIWTGRRDGLSVGTRSANFGYVTGGVVRREDELAGARGELGFVLAGWQLSIAGSAEQLDSVDRRNYVGPSPVDPTFTQSERFRADVESTSVNGSARGRRTFDGKVSAEFDLEFEDVVGSGTMHSLENALSTSGDPFERITEGDSDLSETRWSAKAGVRREVSPDLAWRGGLQRIEERSGGDLVTDTLLEDPPGSPPSQLVQHHSLEFESELYLVEAGLEASLSPGADIDVSLEGGLDHEIIRDESDGLVVNQFDDNLLQLGAVASLSIETSDEVTVALTGGYGLAPTHDPDGQSMMSLEDERGLFTTARVRWRPERGISFTGTVGHRQRDVESLGSHYETTSLSIAGCLQTSTDWSVDATYSLRSYGLVADTLVPILGSSGPPQLVPAEARFEGLQHVLAACATWWMTSQLHPRLCVSGATTTGDAEVDYGTVFLDLPWDAAEHLTLGVETDLHRFDAGSGTPASDYDSAAFVVYLRTAF